MIKVKDLNKYYYKNKKNEIHVLNDVSLDLGEKGLVSIHGASGSGKTTLLNVIGGLDKVQDGDIQFYDEYLPKYKSRVWDKLRNEDIGFVFQNYYLLPALSVFDNIAFVLKNIGLADELEIEKRVNYVLKAVGMYPFRKKKALQLSGGQQQRVAIARALVKNPKVILADEPTGNLDSKNSVEVMNIIKQISKETLVVLVTHEKKLASIYSDRIVYIEDGKIVEDTKNNNNFEHEFTDNTIYLKDLKNKKELKNDEVNLNIYSDEKLENINVNLILKNETLYLDVKGYDNVKLADKSSGVTIKDEHYKKKTKEEVTQTEFDVSELDHSNIEKDKGVIFSLKKTFKLAFTKLLGIGRKGKLMLFSFFVAGMIIAYAVASLASVGIIRPEQKMNLPKGYIEFYQESHNSNNMVSVNDLNKKLNNNNVDEKFYVNPYLVDANSLYFLNSDNSIGLNAYVTFDNISHAKNYSLVVGSYSNSVNELVVTTAFADQLLEETQTQDFGIWERKNLLYETLKFSNQDAKIVGIVESDIDLVFADDAFIYYLHGKSLNDLSFKPVEAYKDLNLVGTVPTNNDEIVLSLEKTEELYGSIDSLTFPVNHEIISNGSRKTYKITAVHELEKDLILTSTKALKNATEVYKTAVYSSNPNKTIEDLEEEFGLIGTDVYESAVRSLKDQQTVNLLSTLITTAILVGVTLIGFYFVIRSSLIERIYEVAVYRALGVKKSEIARSFLVEIITITTITSFVGFILMSYILSNLQKGFIGELNFFYVNSLSVMGGVLIVYVLNTLAGLLPVYMLLRKTPSQILTQYDI